MPKVGKKTFSYDKPGMRAAAAERLKAKKKAKKQTSY